MCCLCQSGRVRYPSVSSTTPGPVPTQPPRGSTQHVLQPLSAPPGHGPLQGGTAGTLCGGPSDLLHHELPREPRGTENDDMVGSAGGDSRHCFGVSRQGPALVTAPLIG